MEFEKLVENILNEISQPSPSMGDPVYRKPAAYNPQAGYGNPESRQVQSADRSHGLKSNPLGVIMVKWKGSNEARPLKNPETKQVLTYRYSKAMEKVKAMEASGKYERVFFSQTETD